MPADMAEQGMKYADEYMGGLTPDQRKRVDANLDALRQLENKRDADGKSAADGGLNGGGIIAVNTRAVVGEEQAQPDGVVLCGAIGVMFLLFTASSSAGSLLDEADSGTLDRVLSSRVTMTKLLAGKAGL